MSDLAWQPSLLSETEQPSVDRAFTGLVRHRLDDAAWVDHVPGWVRGHEAVFQQVFEKARWTSQTRRMYDKIVDQPRLHATWKRSNGEPFLPIIAEMAAALGERYGHRFTTGGLNLYRDGRDSVAWHGDRIPKEIAEPVVGIVSLGHPRTFRLRPKGGGKSLPIVVHGGDLVVTGGTCQRTWEHAILKVKSAGPRISITFRHVDLTD